MRADQRQSSTGLFGLIRYAEETVARGGGITLVGAGKKITIVLEMLDLTKKFVDVRSASLVPPSQPPSRLTFSRRMHGRGAGVALLEVTGAIDERTVDAELDPILTPSRHGVRDVVLDCTGLLALRGRGLERLLRHARTLAHLGGSLALLGVSREAKSTLETGGLEQAFSVVCMDRPTALLS